MPGISTRGRQMPESPIRKLVPYAEAAKIRGIKVYHLNIGQPDIETPKNALNKIKNIALPVIEYSHSAGFESYRRGLVKYYRQHNIEVEHTDILITTGGSEAILFGLMTCLNPGDEIIIPEPFYTNYNGFCCASGVSVRSVTSKIENGFALPPVSEFEKLITSKTRAIMLCNPNNPTGYLYSKKELEQLSDIVKKHNLYLFSDEVYREFCYDGKKHFSVMNLEGIEQNAIMVDSISKRYSMCGARVGAIVSKNKDVMKTALKYAQARLSPPTFGQIAGEAALETPFSYFEDVSRQYTERRDLVVESLNNIKGVFCPKPSGAFYVIARLPIDDCDKFCRWLLEDFEFNRQTVMLAPATGFYSTKGFGKDEVRIAYVLNIDSLINAMKCLEEGLKQYHSKSS